jgi:hypothetical protein
MEVLHDRREMIEMSPFVRRSKHHEHEGTMTEAVGRWAIGLCILTLAVAMPGTATADRHCSFARESAFYAESLSADAMKASASACPAKLKDALERLQETRIELDICSCAPAQEPLKQWFGSRPKDVLDPKASCAENAHAINGAAKTVLIEVEKCF